MLHGDDIYVTIDINGQQQPIAAAKSGDFDISQDFIKACAPNSGRTFIKIPTTYEWSVSCDCLMATSQYAKKLIDAVRNGTKYTLQFIVCGFKVVGDVYVKFCRIQTSKGSLAKLAVSFESSGDLYDSETWDVINGTLFTYSNFDEATKTLGYMNEADRPKNGTFVEDEQNPENNTLYTPQTPSES